MSTKNKREKEESEDSEESAAGHLSFNVSIHVNNSSEDNYIKQGNLLLQYAEQNQLTTCGCVKK